MPNGARPSPEEFYSQCMANVQVLDSAARRLVEEREPTAALACAWGADVFAVQAVLWERVLVAAPVPARKYFRAAEAMFAVHAGRHDAGLPATTAADALLAGRARLLADFDAVAQDEITDQWCDAGYLDAMPVPTTVDIAEAAATRLQGMSAGTFVATRRQEAQRAMAEAQALRVRGDTTAAIHAAYDSDMLSFEAYLVESAMAAGDSSLFTVTIRWELVVAALRGVPGLPGGFVAAVTAIRDALGRSLIDADAERMQGALIVV